MLLRRFLIVKEIFPKAQATAGRRFREDRLDKYARERWVG
jgi:hypothetical protein